MLGAAPPLGAATRCTRPPGIILVLGVQYAPLVVPHAARGPARAAARADRGGPFAAGAGRDGAAHDRAAADDAAAARRRSRCASSRASGNFGIPALLGIPANYLVLPTLIYQRLAGLGPARAVGSRRAVAADRNHRRARHRRCRTRCCARRDFRISTATTTARAVRTAALASARRRSHCGSLLVVVLVAAAAGAGADVARSRGRRAARRAFGDAGRIIASCCSSMRPPSARSATASRLSAAAAVDDRADRGSARVFPGVAPARGCCALSTSSPKCPYALPGVVLAIAAILLFLKPMPAGRHLDLQHRLDHPVLLPRALPGARPAAGDQRLSSARPHARGGGADRRRAARCGGCARSSCRWSRRRPPPARC